VKGNPAALEQEYQKKKAAQKSITKAETEIGLISLNYKAG
jgi:hypothetical protein